MSGRVAQVRPIKLGDLSFGACFLSPLKGLGGGAGLTLPSECVSLNRAGFENHTHPRGRRGGGNVGIGFIDFQGLWEGRKTALPFSGLSINRHFHGLALSPPAFMLRFLSSRPSNPFRTASG
jgi:hypothetical protein